ncbi:hypothetical protein B0H13DRAFT_2321592 [Mycena leptocephala]|nr:hypothetical protein B0H13DRAFT_2321592 [Mycena leptocephala]
MPKASSSAIPRPGPLRELPLDLFLRNPNLPQMPNSRATSGVARLLSPTECRLLADEDLISGLRVGALPYRDRLVKFSSPTERRMHAKEGLITGVRTSRVGAPLYRDPPVNFSEHRILAEQGLVSGVRTLRVGAPPVYRDTPPVNFRCACVPSTHAVTPTPVSSLSHDNKLLSPISTLPPVSSGTRCNSPRPSAADTQSIHYPGFQVCLDTSASAGSVIIHNSETPQGEKENVPPRRRLCKSASSMAPDSADAKSRA